jgi:hypothetical protein
MSDKIRVLRIIEYVGDREWVEETLKGSLVPIDGIKVFGRDNQNLIKSCIIDKFPEILNKSEI